MQLRNRIIDLTWNSIKARETIGKSNERGEKQVQFANSHDLGSQSTSALIGMKNGNAIRIDGITVDLTKYAGIKIPKILAGVYKQFCRSVHIPRNTHL